MRWWLAGLVLACGCARAEPEECFPSFTTELPLACVPDPGSFAAGPYGEKPGDLAADLSVHTLDGDLTLSSLWTGCDTWVFLALDPGAPAGRALLDGSWTELFAKGPKDVHYVFFSTRGSDAEAAEDAQLMQGVARRQLAANSDASAAFEGRLHFPTVALAGSGWPGRVIAGWEEVTDGYEPFGFVIDPSQRLRELGSLQWPAAAGWPPAPQLIGAAARAARHEAEQAWRLYAENATVVPLFAQPVQGSATATVKLPDLSRFGRMALDLRLSCPSGFDRSCGEWDYLIYLRVCDAADPGKCDTELGRWITAYHRGGHWVTDVTPLMALLGKGGTRTFRFETSNAYVVDLSLRLSRTCQPDHPAMAIPLWKGGGFDLGYNPAHPPITVDIPADASRVQLVAVITGHGFGSDAANCSEFCNHEHRFTVGGGPEYVKSFPMAGTVSGCLDQVEDGVTPNQYGTWIFGRGGWCPGFKVEPWVVDVTGYVHRGKKNEIAYRATFQGHDYDPQPVEMSSGFAGRIDMESWLVVWK